MNNNFILGFFYGIVFFILIRKTYLNFLISLLKKLEDKQKELKEEIKDLEEEDF